MKPSLTLLADFVESGKPFMVRNIVRPAFATDFHAHKECQLVYIVSGTGKRVIGDSVDTFGPGDMTFVGPNVPHVWYSDVSVGTARSIALYISPDVVLQQLAGFIDTTPFDELFQQSRRGMCLTGKTRQRLYQLMVAMLKQSEVDRLISFIRILQLLSQTDECVWLNSRLYTTMSMNKDHERVRRVMQYLFENFRGTISLESTAEVAGLQLNAFCRFFKSITLRTFSDFLNELRINHACQLLQQTDQPITQLIYACGYNNVGYFNRTFKRLKGMTPRAYRVNWRRVHYLG